MRRDEVCGHKNNVSLHNSDKIQNVGWGSIIDTATRVWAGWSGVQTLVFFSFENHTGWLRGPPAFVCNRYWCSFLGGQSARPELTTHTHPSN